MRIFIVVFLLLITATVSAASDREATLRAAMAYLNDIKEITWVEVVNHNQVIIGWNAIPKDFNIVNRGAALKGDRSIGYATYVWSVNASQRGWRPVKGPYICSTRARTGQVLESDCR